MATKFTVVNANGNKAKYATPDEAKAAQREKQKAWQGERYIRKHPAGIAVENSINELFKLLVQGFITLEQVEIIARPIRYGDAKGKRTLVLTWEHTTTCDYFYTDFKSAMIAIKEVARDFEENTASHSYGVAA